MNMGAGPGDIIVSWRLVLLVGAGGLGVVLLIGLLALLDNPRTRGKAVLLLFLAVLFLGAMMFTVRLAESPAQHATEDVIAQRATEAMLRTHAPAGSKEGDVTVVLSPPDAADAGKTPDDQISVKVQKDQWGGKGTVIYIKANRMLESFGKNLLETIRHTAEKESDPAKSLVPALQAAAAAAGAPTPSGNGAAAKAAVAAAAGVAKPSPVPSAKKTAPASAKSPAQTAKQTPKAKAPSPADAVYEETVTAYGKTEADAEAVLDDELEKAFSRYVDRRLGLEAAERVQLPASELRQRIASKSRENVESKELGSMVQLTALVRFDKALQEVTDRQWAKARLSERLWYAGGGLGAVVLLLSVVYGYLKIDLATAGAYRWRLRLAAAAVLIGMVAAGVAFIH